MQPAVEEQFEAFYFRNERSVGQFVVGMLGDASLAADAVQETWFLYLRYVDCLEPRFDTALLFAVARNVVRTIRRRRRPEYPASRMEHRADGRSFEDSVLMSDLVARLPYPEREVIVLHYALDLPLETICNQLGQPHSTVKSRLYRARRRLRDAYMSGEGKQSGAE